MKRPAAQKRRGYAAGGEVENTSPVDEDDPKNWRPSTPSWASDPNRAFPGRPMQGLEQQGTGSLNKATGKAKGGKVTRVTKIRKRAKR